jgi:16S rRNA (guanine527-N7)-methyltransferase
MTDLASIDREALAADRAAALALIPVSRETEARLDRFIERLVEFQQHTNLIAPSTIPTIWSRHVADSLQLLALAPEARVWVDLGSGGGFPGLVIAAALADRPGTTIHLVESKKKKAKFLEETARLIGAPAQVHPVRIEDFVQNFRARADAVTARALAPLEALLGLAEPLLRKGAHGLFLKGQDVASELTQASKCWNIESELVPSKTQPQSRIVIVRGLKRRDPKR